MDVCEGIQIRFTDIGHLLGSASIEVWLEENGVKKKLVFSGDIGNKSQPLIKAVSYTHLRAHERSRGLGDVYKRQGIY